MTSIYQLIQCSAFVMVISCHSLAPPAAVVLRPTNVRSDQVKNRRDFGRDIDLWQKKKDLKVRPGTPAAAAAAAAPSAAMTRLTVRVTPKNSMLPLRPMTGIHLRAQPSAPISIRCRIKCILEKVEHLPIVSFYIQIENETILPLSAGMPGVDIFTAASDSRLQKPFRDADNRRAVLTYRSDIHLTLNSDAYPILLRPGDNQFFCQASSPSIGLLKSDGFIVSRQW